MQQKTLRHFWIDNEDIMYDGICIVANMMKSSGGMQEYLVMPGEEPHVYASVRDAVGQVADMISQYSHDVGTARVFRLVPVPIEEIEGKLGAWNDEN